MSPIAALSVAAVVDDAVAERRRAQRGFFWRHRAPAFGGFVLWSLVVDALLLSGTLSRGVDAVDELRAARTTTAAEWRAMPRSRGGYYDHGRPVHGIGRRALLDDFRRQATGMRRSALIALWGDSERDRFEGSRISSRRGDVIYLLGPAQGCERGVWALVRVDDDDRVTEVERICRD